MARDCTVRFALLALVAALAGGCPTEDEPPPPPPLPELVTPLHLVDPFIGTGGTGVRSSNCFPGPTAPWGMVQVGPDTVSDGGAASWFNHAAGYHYDDTQIVGFSHTRLQGVSTPDQGAVLLAPAVGGDPEDLITEEGRRVGFSHDHETAAPGLYDVALHNNVFVSLTATTHAAVHRYSYGVEGTPRVAVALSHALPTAEVIDAWLQVDQGGAVVEGWVQHDGRFTGDSAGGMITHFHARFSTPFAAVATWSDDTLHDGVTEQTGPECGAVLDLDLGDDDVVEIVVGISFVDLDGARANAEAALAIGDFFAVVAEAEAAWDATLGRVRFGGGTADQQAMMATALYHGLLVPSVFTDADGRYRGLDDVVHTADGWTYHSNFSMWDTYRTTHPLLCLAWPERQNDMNRSLLSMGDQGGYLPRWPMGYGYTSGTAGAPVDIVLADAVLRGADDFDTERALQLMLQAASAPPPPGHPFAGREGIEEYVALGYVPADVTGRSTTETLEYAIADHAIAGLAAHLGEDAVAAEFAVRAGSYASLWVAEDAVFGGRYSDGSWVPDLDPLVYEDEDLFYGGSAMHYAWMVQHDMPGLIALHGSEATFVDRLQAWFEASEEEQANLDDITAAAPAVYYYHGNEPDLHAAYLFLAAGRPDLAQRWVHWAQEVHHSATPDGIAGNEDAGAMSSWYVWSALGLYPVPGTDLLLVGRPLFPVAEVAVAGGVLRIEAPGADDDHYYVQSVTLDGDALPHPWVRHADLVAGGTLRFELGDEPGEWGRDFGDPR